jgi:hypothetical protein
VRDGWVRKRSLGGSSHNLKAQAIVTALVKAYGEVALRGRC